MVISLVFISFFLCLSLFLYLSLSVSRPTSMCLSFPFYLSFTLCCLPLFLFSLYLFSINFSLTYSFLLYRYLHFKLKMAQTIILAFYPKCKPLNSSFVIEILKKQKNMNIINHSIERLTGHQKLIIYK